MRMQIATVFVLAIALGPFVPGAFVAAQALAQPPSRLAGSWGGDRIRVVAGSETVQIQVDCHLASLDRPLSLDAAGKFTIEATFVPIRGVPLDGTETPPPLRVVGRLEKDVLQITIGPEGTEPAGTFTLQRNGKPKLPNCKMRS
jgi:hypothetical protein